MEASVFHEDVRQAFKHIRYLSQTIGGRGSCTLKERQASDYALEELRQLGLREVQTQPFKAIPSTYWGYALAFAVALTGAVVVFLFDGWAVRALAAFFSLAGVWAFLAEAEFGPSWARWVLPRAPSQNVFGKVPPRREVRQRVVLCAHVDTHRTPIFYSSALWHALFSMLVAFTFLSMVIAAVTFGLGAWLQWANMRPLALGLMAVQFFGLAMCLHADFTPYSPGANDNASGVGAVLALGSRLRRKPLRHTEVTLLFTGCEEVGDWGMAAFLDAHASRMGPEAIYIILDEVGLGRLKFLTADGLLFKHKTHPRALELARQVKQSLPEVEVTEGVGTAYTDALQATKRGLIALTLCAVPPPKSGLTSHWHRMSDTVETLRKEDLEAALRFTWALLQSLDQAATPRQTESNLEG